MGVLWEPLSSSTFDFLISHGMGSTLTTTKGRNPPKHLGWKTVSAQVKWLHRFVPSSPHWICGTALTSRISESPPWSKLTQLGGEVFRDRVRFGDFDGVVSRFLFCWRFSLGVFKALLEGFGGFSIVLWLSFGDFYIIFTSGFGFLWPSWGWRAPAPRAFFRKPFRKSRSPGSFAEGIEPPRVPQGPRLAPTELRRPWELAAKLGTAHGKMWGFVCQKTLTLQQGPLS